MFQYIKYHGKEFLNHFPYNYSQNNPQHLYFQAAYFWYCLLYTSELGGWEAESEASQLLQNLNIPEELHYQNMSELANGDKVKVLLAKALFGKPDVLLLDEPTNGLDIQSITWLEDFLIDFDNTVIVVSHDRHFLNKVCTHMADLDFGKIKLLSLIHI